MCSNNRHVFMSSAFDTFNFLTSEVVDFLHNKVQRVMLNNVMFSIFINVVFTMIDFIIQKDVAAQLVACMSSIYV